MSAELDKYPGVGIGPLAHETGMSDAVALDALPETQRVGVRGSEMRRVWKSRRLWLNPVTVVWKSGQKFSIQGPFEAGVPESRTGALRFDTADGAFGAQPYSPAIGAIYAYTDQEGDRATSAVAFFDRTRELIFDLVPTDAPASAGNGLPADFLETFRQIKTFDAVCEK